MNINNKYIEISKEVQNALNNNLPIVALESTVITHGMEYPVNLEIALELENIVRKEKCIPATICLLKGKIRIGLEKEELEYIAKNKNLASKCSSRDIPFGLLKYEIGSTTVAATGLIASSVGIKVFATGGLGGVHRGYENTMDVSNDLVELGKIPISVFCAGVKSILDIPRTLEFLETQGIQILGYKTDEMPSFYSKKSGCKLTNKVDNNSEISELIKITYNELKLKRAFIVAIPIPDEFEADGEIIEKAIKESILEMNNLNISGNKVTPFLLKRVAEKTEGKSLNANLELIKNNTRIASQVCYQCYNN